MQRSVVIDLDGVVWLAGEPLAGVGAACSALRQAGFHLQFATNNSAPTNTALRQRLADAEIPCDRDDLITAAQAAASLLSPGSRVLTVGEDGFSWLKALAILGWDPEEATCSSCGKSQPEYFYVPRQEFFCASCVRKLPLKLRANAVLSIYGL